MTPFRSRGAILVLTIIVNDCQRFQLLICVLMSDTQTCKTLRSHGLLFFIFGTALLVTNLKLQTKFQALSLFYDVLY